MPIKEFRAWLNDNVYIVVEFETVHGEVVCFVVRLMLCATPDDLCVVRYDTAHGKPHRDLMNRTGRLLEKEWLLGMNFEEALQHAIRDLRAHHESYIADFTK